MRVSRQQIRLIRGKAADYAGEKHVTKKIASTGVAGSVSPALCSIEYDEVSVDRVY